MLLLGIYQVFMAGFIGGALLELLHWYNLRRKPAFPRYAKSTRYWLVTLAMAAAGGVLAVAYFGDRADGIVALHVGLSCPLILQKLATTVATHPGAKSPGAPGLTDFFRW